MVNSDDDPNYEGNNNKPSSSWLAARKLTGIGSEIVASILGMGLLGYGCDRFIWKSTTPTWCTIIGLILGVIGGLYNAIKKANNFFKEK